MSTDNHWLASAARHRFSELIDAAVAGRPQTVKRRDGREVVVVSREYFEANRPTLKSYLLNYTFDHENDDGSFEAALEEGGRLMSIALTPTFQFEEEFEHDDAGHGRDERSTAAEKVGE